jgi:hypothetical protein
MRTQQMHQPGKNAVPRIILAIVVMLVAVPVTAGLPRPPHRRKSHGAKDAPIRDAATAWLVDLSPRIGASSRGRAGLARFVAGMAT